MYVIEAEGLGKQYRIGGKQERYRALRDVLTDSLRAPFRRMGRLLRGQAGGAADLDTTFWALRDVSFKVEPGEVVGIIGRNGAGKSTLLKILSRITEPSTGEARIRGRVGSLLEVGTGFHPELTGRENIYLNGAILGMHKSEIDRKFDEIVDFAETEKFLDTPVKFYSSGMYVRLAFAVAAHLETEVLLVDEVLAVGDVAFQKKCLGKMGDVASGGRTVLFVSHNMTAISRLCSWSIWLDEGQVLQNGATEQVISSYLTSGVNQDGCIYWEDGVHNPGVDEFDLLSVRIQDAQGNVVTNIDSRNPFWVALEYSINKPLPYSRIGFLIYNIQGVLIFETYDSDNDEMAGKLGPGRYVATCEIPARLLSPGAYSLTLNAGTPNVKNYLHLSNVLSFFIEDLGSAGSHVFNQRQGVIRPQLKWKRGKL